MNIKSKYPSEYDLVKVLLCALYFTFNLGASEHGKKEISFGDDLIPLFEQNCIKCHGGPDPRRKGKIVTKGDLNLTEIESIREFFIASKPNESPLYQLTVTDDEDEIMPPKGRHLSTSESQLIYKWIQQGAHFGDFVYIPRIRSRYEILIDKAKPAPEELLQKLVLQKAIVTRVSQQGPLLRVSLREVKILDTNLIKSLILLAPYISDLDLSRVQLPKGELDFLKDFKNLTNLNLRFSNISNEGLTQISHLPNVEQINLYSTPISDLSSLGSFPALRRITLNETKVAQPDVDKALSQIPKMEILYKSEI
jgi:Leucine-rich repeat (LRR) protein